VAPTTSPPRSWRRLATRLAEAVTDGRLTQEQADERAAELPRRLGELVAREGLGRQGPRRPARGTRRSRRRDGSPAEPSSLSG
jgi:hypothetical protein